MSAKATEVLRMIRHDMTRAINRGRTGGLPAMTTTREILVKARALVEQTGGAYDLLSAIREVAPTWVEAETAGAAIRRVTDRRFGRISNWLDKGRTQAEVLAAFDKAIAMEGEE